MQQPSILLYPLPLQNNSALKQLLMRPGIQLITAGFHIFARTLFHEK